MKRLVMMAIGVCVLAVTIAACGSSSSSSSGSSEPAGSSDIAAETSGGEAAGDELASTSADGTPAQVTEYLENAFGAGAGVKLSELPPVAQAAYKLLAKPVSAEEKAVIERCLKTTGVCDLEKTGSEATLNVAESEDTPSVYYNKEQRPITLLMALRLPQVKSVSYTQAELDIAQAQSNFRAHVAEGANVIVGAFSLGDAMLPVIREAAAKGVTVWADTQSVPSATFNGSDLGGDTLIDLCKYGESLGDLALEAGKTVAMYTGPPGNSYAPQWQPCAKKTIEGGGGSVVEEGNTEWSPQGEQQAAVALAAKGSLPSALIYDYTPQAMMEKFLALGQKPPAIASGTTTYGAYKAWKEAQQTNLAFNAFNGASQLTFAGVNLYAAVAQHEGQEVGPHVVLPEPFVPTGGNAKYYNAKLPAGAVFGSGLPDDILEYSFANANP
jgi:Periplasmic binding protein domain